MNLACLGVSPTLHFTEFHITKVSLRKENSHSKSKALMWNLNVNSPFLHLGSRIPLNFGSEGFSKWLQERYK